METDSPQISPDYDDHESDDHPFDEEAEKIRSYSISNHSEWTTKCIKQSITFFELPLEIRSMIYQELEPKAYDDQGNQEEILDLGWSPPAMFYCSKGIQAEMRSGYEKHFRLDVGSVRWGSDIDGATRKGIDYGYRILFKLVPGIVFQKLRFRFPGGGKDYICDVDYGRSRIDLKILEYPDSYGDPHSSEIHAIMGELREEMEAHVGVYGFTEADIKRIGRAGIRYDSWSDEQVRNGVSSVCLCEQNL